MIMPLKSGLFHFISSSYHLGSLFRNRCYARCCDSRLLVVVARDNLLQIVGMCALRHVKLQQTSAKEFAAARRGVIGRGAQ